MSKFYFVRHGQSEANANLTIGTPVTKLSQQGIEQARLTGMKLKDKNITKIVCSPFIRAQQTAETIAGELGIELSNIEIIEELHERRMGDTEGKPKVNENEWFYEGDDGPNMEKRQALLDRTIIALEKIAKIASSEKVAVVGHGVSGFYLIQVAKGHRTLDEFDKHFHMDNADFVEVEIE